MSVLFHCVGTAGNSDTSQNRCHNGILVHQTSLLAYSTQISGKILEMSLIPIARPFQKYPDVHLYMFERTQKQTNGHANSGENIRPTSLFGGVENVTTKPYTASKRLITFNRTNRSKDLLHRDLGL